MSTQRMRRIACSGGLYAICATASVSAPATALAAPSAWQACSEISQNAERLVCFDQWAAAQVSALATSHVAAQPLTAVPAASARHTEDIPAALHAAASHQQLAATEPEHTDCYSGSSNNMLRFYELRRDADCGNFKLRGYHPQSVSLTTASRINTQPRSPSQPAPAAEDYQKQELRIQLSLRTKVASGLLTPRDSNRLDSLWVGYTQLSFWQVFNGDLSRPFRTTDHQPEIFYVYPTEAQLPLGGRLRYSGVGFIHHSNGQSDPLSRSWNRAYLMAGAEWHDRVQLQLKAWHRISERIPNDDNPGIQNYWGRGEAKMLWQASQRNTFGLTVRGSLGQGYGSGRLEWLYALGERRTGGKSNLRLHVQLFSGYGESLIDYNYKRTSLSVGLSLLDF